MRLTATPARASLVVLFLLVTTFAATLCLSYFVSLPAEEDFNIAEWETRHVSGKWLYLAGRLVRGDLSEQEEDARIARYLDLTARIERAQTEEGRSVVDAFALEDQRASIENDVEATIEGRITEALEYVGLTSSLPLFPSARWVFPPVDVEFDEPPSELVVSPRDRIELVDQRPLSPDLSLDEIVALEAREERNGRSALAEPLSGVATYPSLVGPRSAYRQLIEVAAHEWAHQYLFFHPLGRDYRSSLERRTLNETVATVAGVELAEMTALRDPLRAPYNEAAAAQRPATVDVDAVLRQLRADVDALLASGQIQEAEELMEFRRQELADQGVIFRRINQAFFAFRSVYATEAGSTDPIGLKVLALRDRAGSLGSFLEQAAKLTTEEDLDRALAG